MIDIRLGNAIFSSSERFQVLARGAYRDKPTLDAKGYRASVGTGGVGAVRRHDNLQDLLHNLLRDLKFSVNVYREKTFAADLRKDPSECRALDLVIDNAAFAPTPQEMDVTSPSPTHTATSPEPAQPYLKPQRNRNTEPLTTYARRRALIQCARRRHRCLQPTGLRSATFYSIKDVSRNRT
eukprot:GFKZ01000797.1.p1 GENE.GFKZ01000797.1~~GFKZ01000797.1.p1  ORF type:complete len:181 (+),score=4.54 GFKZ01000797.1:909-1451(+)